MARTLKAACGLTPTAWINRQRLTRAAALLATTSLPIVDISLDCGFENLSYFYRRFGQQYGQAPRACRLLARRRILPAGAQDESEMPETLSPGSLSGVSIAQVYSSGKRLSRWSLAATEFEILLQFQTY